MEFVKWSKLNPQAKKILKPNLDIKSWNEISVETKQLILKHFENSGWFKADNDMYQTVANFDRNHKAGDYCRHLLGHGGPHYHAVRANTPYRLDCCDRFAYADFQNICLRRDQDVVYELISYYAEHLKVRDGKIYEKFKAYFNDNTEQFGLNIMLNDNGLMLRQEPKIDSEIYVPVLNYLSEKKWQPVNQELTDAFSDYLKNTPENYSSCITHAIAALEAFLQIINGEKIGSKKLNLLIKDGIANNMIPNDPFSQQIFKEIESILMQERHVKGDSHPKIEYANEKTSKLVLNLVMVFMQHVIQK